MKLNSLTLGLIATIALSASAVAQDDDNQAKYDKKITEAWINSGGWELDYDKALAAATAEGKYVLAYFSRSYSP
jgi:lipid-binding SYLF domain-containing protein